MKLYLEVKADTNDGDYITERSEISEAQLEKFKQLIKQIKKKGAKHGHNWCTSEYAQDLNPTEMYTDFCDLLVEEFNEYVPVGEYGVHTICSIKLLRVESEEILL